MKIIHTFVNFARSTGYKLNLEDENAGRRLFYNFNYIIEMFGKEALLCGYTRIINKLFCPCTIEEIKDDQLFVYKGNKFFKGTKYEIDNNEVDISFFDGKLIYAEVSLEFFLRQYQEYEKELEKELLIE